MAIPGDIPPHFQSAVSCRDETMAGRDNSRENDEDCCRDSSCCHRAFCSPGVQVGPGRAGEYYMLPRVGYP